MVFLDRRRTQINADEKRILEIIGVYPRVSAV